MNKLKNFFIYSCVGLVIIGFLGALFEKKEKPKEAITTTEQSEPVAEKLATNENNNLNNEEFDKYINFFNALIYEDFLLGNRSTIEIPEKIIDITKIEQEYYKNEVKGDNLFLHKRIFVGGKVYSVSRNAFNARTIKIGDNSYAVMASSKFNENKKTNQKNQDTPYLGFLGELKQNHEVILSCEVSGLILNSVSLKNCVPAYVALPYKQIRLNFYNKIELAKNNDIKKYNDFIVGIYAFTFMAENCDQMGYVSDWDYYPYDKIEKCTNQTNQTTKSLKGKATEEQKQYYKNKGIEFMNLDINNKN
jgi:hypothetical protein